MIRSPDVHHQGFIPHQQPNLMLPSNHVAGGSANSILNASQSTHSSNNFYENTMRSDVSSLHKRKSVISSQSTGSSNDVGSTFASNVVQCLNFRLLSANTSHICSAITTSFKEEQRMQWRSYFKLQV